MSTPSESDQSIYYVPEQGWYPVFLAFGLMVTVTGLAAWMNDLRGGDSGDLTQTFIGFLITSTVLYFWFAKAIAENASGMNNAALNKSYVLGMGWFIFSEVWFFLAFFGALFYVRMLAIPWMDGDGARGLTGTYLWPEFQASWPLVVNPDPVIFENPGQSMAPPALGVGWLTYLPFLNTVILLSSSVTVHFAHGAIHNQERKKIMYWLGTTVLLGFIFVGLQILEYYEAVAHMGLTLGSGIYGSTFFLLTGFHGFHVTMGTFILLIQFFRVLKGHFTANDCFGFEAGSWYWHFVDVVWVGLFIFVYVL
jgi:cytochrome c oxidase subunit 3